VKPEWTFLIWQLRANRFLLLRRKSNFYLKQLLQSAGLTRGHATYKRFVILCCPRSGSNLLRSLLNSHTQIIALSELFRGFVPINWGLPGFSQRLPVWTLYRNDPVQFLDRVVFREYPSGIDAVGFKLLYDHVQKDGNRSICSHLQQDNKLRIIHLKRRNLLRCLISLKRAKLTDEWVNVNGRPSREVSLVLDPGECFEALETMRRQELEADRLFRKSDLIDIYYEDLDRNQQHEILRVQKFLGVPVLSLKPSLYRITRQPLSKVILNYDEIKGEARGTPWEAFFDD